MWYQLMKCMNFNFVRCSPITNYECFCLQLICCRSKIKLGVDWIIWSDFTAIRRLQLIIHKIVLISERVYLLMKFRITNSFDLQLTSSSDQMNDYKILCCIFHDILHIAIEEKSSWENNNNVWIWTLSQKQLVLNYVVMKNNSCWMFSPSTISHKCSNLKSWI